jgi:hypothetical protein
MRLGLLRDKDTLVTAAPASYLVLMPVRKKTRWFDEDVWLAVERHAEGSGTTPSGVVHRAVHAFGQLQADKAAMDEWQLRRRHSGVG